MITSLSPFSSASPAAGFAGPHVHSYQPLDLRPTEGGRAGEGRSMRPEADRSWRAIPAAMLGLSARLVGVFAAGGEFAFSGLLLAFLSWTIAQVLAGCAAYAQAMYPCVTEDGFRARTGSPAGAPGESGRRLAIEDSHAFGDRSPRGVGLSRCDIEQITRRGDRCA
jgi:hypothetical protein